MKGPGPANASGSVKVDPLQGRPWLSSRADGADSVGVKAGIRGGVVVVVSGRDSSSFKNLESDPWTTWYYTP